MSVLVPCPSCARHVRASESACPFCAGALPRDLAARAVPRADRRLNRIAAFTFAASVAVTGGAAAVGCGGSIDETGIDPGGSGGGGGGGDDGTADSGGTVDDDGGVAAMYGLPGPVDAAPYDAALRDGGTKDASTRDASAKDAGSTDSGPKDDGGIAPMYGIAADAGPMDDGGGQALYGLPPEP